MMSHVCPTILPPSVDEAPDSANPPRYFLRLFVTGSTPRSLSAIKNLRAFCEENLGDRFELEVIDIYQQPQLAVENGLLAAPTLVKELPLPVRRLIGDLSDRQRVSSGLDLRQLD